MVLSSHFIYFPVTYFGSPAALGKQTNKNDKQEEEAVDIKRRKCW